MSKIILLEDDADLCETLAEGLTAHGYQVITEKRVSSVMTRKLIMPDVAAVIMDMRLEDSSSTIILRMMRADHHLKSVKTIVISGHDDSEARAAFWGADLFLPKPVTLAKLREALQSLGVS